MGVPCASVLGRARADPGAGLGAATGGHQAEYADRHGGKKGR